MITKARINEFENDTKASAYINVPSVPYTILNIDNGTISWNLDRSFAWIPHRYAIGNVICYDNTFAVVIDNVKCPSNITDLDSDDMSFNCVTFERNWAHSCGGVFIQECFLILHIESAIAGLERCPKQLIGFNNFMKGNISAAKFMQEYSLHR